MPTQTGAALRRQTHTHADISTDSPFDIAMQNAFATARPSVRTQAAGSLGQIVFALNRGALRTIITGRRRIVTGSYASRKTARAIPYEGMNEYAFLMHCEVDTNVVDYRAQPFRFEFTLDGKKRVYIADCARLLANSHFEVVEIKNDRRALRDPDYALKLERVSDLCTELGWAFRVVLKQQIINPPQRHANIDQIQSNRHTKFNDLHEYLVLSALERASGTTSLGALADALGGPPEGMAIAQAMMVRRLIDIDLGKPLAADSTVCAVSDAALAPLQEGAQ